MSFLDNYGLLTITKGFPLLRCWGRGSLYRTSIDTYVCYYHHCMKLYQKVSRVCCCLYYYECAAWVTMPTATNEWYFFWYSLVLWWYWFYHTNFWFHCTFRRSARDLQYLIQILTWLVVKKNTAFYKLHAAKASPLTPIHSHEFDIWWLLMFHVLKE